MADSKPTLGKRKEREEGDSLTHGSTLFVSNLPYTATSVDLQTLFSDIAPVRSAFVVTEPGTGISKGVGYVSFALKEDATSAFASLEKDGIELVGRKLRVQWAENKPKEGRDKDAVKKESKPRPPPRAPQPRLPHDPLAIRTVVVSGLPSGIDAKVLWKKIRKYEGAEKVDWPIKNESGVEDPTTAHVLFTTPAHASDTVAKLHAHVYKGALLSVTLKKRLDTLSKPITTIPKTSKPKNLANNEESTAIPTADAKGKAPAVVAPSHASRLIVRNLPFNATEQDLRAIFLPYGPIHSVHIPLDDKPAPKVEGHAESSTTAATRRPRTRGFAFIWMLSRKDAERAIEGCNGMVVRAGTAETLVLDKQKRKKVKRLEKKAAAAAAGMKEGGEEAGEDDVDEDEEMEKEEKEKDDKRATERVIAVDWALSKDKWKEEKAKIQEDENEEMASAPPDSEDDDSEDGLGVHSGGDDNDDNSDSQLDDEDDNGEEPVKPQLPPPETGTTLFIRNIPFNATEDELRTLFRAFGPLRYARITMDGATGRSRGTGFACFWNLADADRVVQQSDLLRSETTGQSTVSKKNPFSLPSILTPDPSSSLAQSLVLHGRTLDVVRAVTRDVAGKLKEDGERMREKADKRNMYLLREGVILPNTPSASLLTPAEVERRTSSFNSRRALLKSNPSLFISKTRLSVRQIPTYVTERMLKRLAGHAMKAFNADIKRGERAPLTSDELAADEIKPEAEAEKPGKGDGEEDKQKPKKKKFTGTKDPLVKQTKIIRQAERVDPLTGKGKSKGYGFIELTKHSDALRFLRWANNNPEVGELFSAWWKDEVEHLLKMAKEGAKSKGKDSKESKEKSEENGVDKGREEERIKRLKAEIEKEGEEVGQRSKRATTKGTLIVEFSIENIQVVQRRDASMHKSKHQEKSSTAATPATIDKRRKREHEDTRHKGSKPSSEEPSPKKRRIAPSEGKVGPKAEPKATPEKKPANALGSLIGRKRKERKVGKKGSK